MNTLTQSPAHKLRRRWIWERIQTAILVVLFTGLIWWTANQAVSTKRSFAIRLRIAKMPGRVIRFSASDEFTVTLSGPQRLLDEIESRLRSHGDILDYTLSQQEAEPTERAEWKSREVLSNTALLVGSGVTVTDASPVSVVLSIDKLTTVSMSVQPDFGSIEVDSVGVSPETVRVTLPEREAARHSRKLTPSAEMQLNNWRSDHPNLQNFSIVVPVALPWVTEPIDPPSVTVTGRVIQLLDTASKGPVQILPAIPLSVQSKYIVQPAAEGEFRTDVSVRGPKDLLAALSAEQIRAYFDIMTADEGLAGQVITRRVIVVLPKGFELVSDPPDVRFKLVAREAAGDGTP